MPIIIDYSSCNFRSICYKLKTIGIDSKVSNNKKDIESADYLILPGIGYFSNCIKKIKDLDLLDLLNYKVLDKKTPILGICLGAQFLMKNSEEGNADGFGWIKGNVKKFDSSINLPIPHIGWDEIDIKKDCILFKDIPSNFRFYFTHSYHMCCDNKEDIASISNYGYDFVSSVQRDNIFGVQFHPEKSHLLGIKVIENFIKYA